MTKRVQELVNGLYSWDLQRGKIKADTETIAHLVAGAFPYENYAIVKGFNKLVLTTFGSIFECCTGQRMVETRIVANLDPLANGPTKY